MKKRASVKTERKERLDFRLGGSLHGSGRSSNGTKPVEMFGHPTACPCEQCALRIRSHHDWFRRNVRARSAGRLLGTTLIGFIQKD